MVAVQVKMLVPHTTIHCKIFMNTIDCVIMDWAGTAIDFGCFAPLHVFLNVFEEQGVPITCKQARKPMGMLKIDHIRAILSMPEVAACFEEVHGRKWNEEDVLKMYSGFEQHLFATLKDFTDPIPGAVDAIESLRARGIKIGSTTGYTEEMMAVVRPAAAEKGYVVDNLVTPSHLPAGRPAPYMIYQNMIDLLIPSVNGVVKVGDTIADIKEGLHAGVHTVGIIVGSNELGLTEQEYLDMAPGRLAEMKADVHRRMFEAGAHVVLDSISDLPRYIEELEKSSN